MIDKSKPTYPLPPYVSHAEHILKNIVDDFGTSILVHTLKHDVYMARYYHFKGE